MDTKKIEAAVAMILEAVGEDLHRDGLKETPKRVAAMYSEIFSGLNQNPSDCLNIFFKAESDDPVSVCKIPFYSMCEHHLLPFYGTVSVIYLPQNRTVTGLSKIARLVDCVSRRPQIQENLTAQIADALTEKLDPLGVLVTVRAEHLCMSMRGVKKQGTQTLTIAARGRFRSDAALRKEALAILAAET